VPTLSPSAAAAIRAAIRLAGGREVCFVCALGDDDAIATARVVARGDVRSVLALPGFARAGELLLHNHPSGVLDPSDADLEIAARMHDQGVGFAITDNDATSVYVVVEVPRAPTLVPLDPASIERDLGVSGPIAVCLPRYEDRPGQRGYARTIARLYNGGGVGVLEAGTGVGKSLGYLLPALRWAAANGERTVVSTNTINLQEQLIGKDLPFLAGALVDQKVRFALLKGWRNYLCLHRLEQARGAGRTLFDGQVESDLDMLTAWSARTTDGSLSDLATPPRDEVWDEVAAESDLCLRLKCPHFERCFLYAARRKAAQADVIVVNHHLLLSDVAVRRATQNWEDAAVLPPYKRLVVDEGHHLEDAAAAHLGTGVTRRTLERLFARLERRGKGLLPTLATRLEARRDLLSVASLDLVHARLFGTTHAARERSALVFDLLESVVRDAPQPVVRLDDDFEAHPVWRHGLHGALEDLLGELGLLADGLRVIRERLESDEATAEAFGALLGEVRGVTRRLQAAGDGLRSALLPDPGATPVVRWIERRGRDRNLAVTAVPLDLAPILRDDVFRRVDTCVITSATLAVDGRFDFLRARLGLDEEDVEPECGIFPSPFDYPSQAMLAIPTDLPAPNVDGQGHAEAVADALVDLIEASDGGVFALFTSHRDVRQAADRLRARQVDRRWPLLVHGEDARDALLRRFREAGRAVLLGTASFWEGVDVPGDPLRALLLARVPFRVPTEPLTAARCERIERAGGDAFAEYMLPDAALRLKQGFGRLIRSSEDCGAIVLMDPRTLTKSYGTVLLDGLPPARRVVGPWSAVRRELSRMFGVRYAVREASRDRNGEESRVTSHEPRI
jgi:ATP-dependent DNA helicase DinG